MRKKSSGRHDMQYVNTKTKQNTNARVLVLTALFAALTTVATMFIKVPTMFGYAHAGDSIIYLGASLLPGPFGIIAASLGGGLADLLSGYPHWIIPSMIIKALNALPFVIARYYLIKKGRDNRIINVTNLIMILPASLATIGGYFIAHVIMYNGWAAGLEGLGGDSIQVLSAAALYIALGVALDGVGFKQKVLK